MTAVRMIFDLVLISTLPPNHMKVVKVGTSLDCSHQCMVSGSCNAMVFDTVRQACYIYSQSLQAVPPETANTGLLMYNSVRKPECSGTNGKMPVIEMKCPVCPTGSDGYKYNSEINVCYKLHTQYANHQVAKDACTRDVPSGLLKIDTPAKRNFFITIMPANTYAYISGRYVDGRWVYNEDGNVVNMTYIGWKEGQPNGLDRSQYCLCLNFEGGNDDVNCADRFYRICEIRMNQRNCSSKSGNM